MNLHLHTPLFYTKTEELSPFDFKFPESETAGEFLFCFELNAEQALRIEPEPDRLLGDLVFAGKRNGKQGDLAEQPSVQLPAGLYLFTQQRKAVLMDECIKMAVEQQKDGLWEREKPENILYIRILYEDESPVTQVLRPVL